MKEDVYKLEEYWLSAYAFKSKDTKGRKYPVDVCNLRTDFQRDRDRIIHSKSFRRLKHKTQVFLSPEGDHYRTRLTHTLEVMQIARSIARGLKLNEDLTEAIALGHDLGHTPFGHAGEKTLSSLTEGYFEHNKQSIRQVEILENNGNGLNLTYEVLDGILNHKKTGNPLTLEGKVVSVSDRIAYINHDIDDAQRAGIIDESQLPKEVVKILGSSSSDRIGNMIMDIVKNSYNKNDVSMTESVNSATEILRNFMFEKVYTDSIAKKEEVKADRMIRIMYNYFYNNKDKLPEFYLNLSGKYTMQEIVCDYIAGMTDNFAIKVFNSVFVPKCWN